MIDDWLGYNLGGVCDAIERLMLLGQDAAE